MSFEFDGFGNAHLHRTTRAEAKPRRQNPGAAAPKSLASKGVRRRENPAIGRESPSGRAAGSFNRYNLSESLQKGRISLTAGAVWAALSAPPRVELCRPRIRRPPAARGTDSRHFRNRRLRLGDPALCFRNPSPSADAHAADRSPHPSCPPNWAAGSTILFGLSRPAAAGIGPRCAGHVRERYRTHVPHALNSGNETSG